jgi:hypothetical protein
VCSSTNYCFKEKFSKFRCEFEIVVSWVMTQRSKKKKKKWYSYPCNGPWRPPNEITKLQCVFHFLFMAYLTMLLVAQSP